MVSDHPTRMTATDHAVVDVILALHHYIDALSALREHLPPGCVVRAAYDQLLANQYAAGWALHRLVRELGGRDDDH